MLRIAFLAHLLVFGASMPAFAEEPPVADQPALKPWTARDLDGVLLKVFNWLPQPRQEELVKLPLVEVKDILAKEQLESPFKMPWLRKDLLGEKDGAELVKIFDDLSDGDAAIRMSSWTLQDAINSLRLATAESAGVHAAANIRIELEEPVVRNPGTANARIFVTGTTTGIKDGLGIRVEAELHYPESDSMPELANSSAQIKANRFQIEMTLPKKILLHGRYWVRVSLDISRVRKREEIMVNGQPPMAFATRVAWVGVDEEFRRSPDNAPPMLTQDAEIKARFLALIESDPIAIGDPVAGFPGDSEDARHWEWINAKLAQHWAENITTGVVPAAALIAELHAKKKEMGEYFDAAIWREFLDVRYYPALVAGERNVSEYSASVLRERFPEYSNQLADKGGIYELMGEYAAMISSDFYTAAGSELPPVDAKRLRDRTRSQKSVLDLITSNLKILKNPKRGACVESIVELLKKLPPKGGR